MHSVSTVHKSHSYINIPSFTAVLTKCYRWNIHPELLPYVDNTITIYACKVKYYPTSLINFPFWGKFLQKIILRLRKSAY